MLRCTPGHIPRYMGRTSNNNNKRGQLWVHSMLCHVCLYRALLRISDFMITILYRLATCFTTCALILRLLLLSPYIIHVPSLILITASLLVPVCWYSRHGFQCIFMTWIYRYTCAYLCSPLGFRITTRRGVLTPLDLMSRFWSLERVDSPSC